MHIGMRLSSIRLNVARSALLAPCLPADLDGAPTVPLVQASVWNHVVLRGDLNNITIGHVSNIQDRTVIHAARCALMLAATRFVTCHEQRLLPRAHVAHHQPTTDHGDRRGARGSRAEQQRRWGRVPLASPRLSGMGAAASHSVLLALGSHTTPIPPPPPSRRARTAGRRPRA